MVETVLIAAKEMASIEASAKSSSKTSGEVVFKCGDEDMVVMCARVVREEGEEEVDGGGHEATKQMGFVLKMFRFTGGADPGGSPKFLTSDQLPRPHWLPRQQTRDDGATR